MIYKQLKSILWGIIISLLFFLSLYATDEADIHFERAKFFSGRGNYLAAVLEYRKTLECNPRYVAAHNNLAILYYQNGFMNDMIEELEDMEEEYLEELPEYIQVLKSLSVISRERKKIEKNCPPCVKGVDDVLEDSVCHLEKAKQLAPDLPQPWYNLGIIYQRQGEYEKALNNLLKVKKVYENDKWYLYYLACTYAVLDKETEALKSLEKAVDKGFNDKYLLEHNSEFDDIRENPKFIKLLSRLSEDHL